MTGRCLGAVLAGGAGSRVGGADKGLMQLHGLPLIAHVIDALRRQCDALLIVANRNLDQYTPYATVIADGRAGHAGPLAGIAAALAQLACRGDTGAPACEWLLTVPVDCPNPPPDLRARLQSALEKSGGRNCASAHEGASAQPLFSLYRSSSVEPLLRSARSALDVHASVLRWHEEIGACAVDFSDRRAAFDNLNTMQDFSDYERTHG